MVVVLAGWCVWSDPGYAETLLLHAEQLFDFGYRCQGNYIVDGRLSAAEPFYL